MEPEVKTLIIIERLHESGVQSAHLSHHLFRTAGTYKEGLTKKEYAYIMSLHEEQKAHMEKIRRVREHIERRQRNGR